MKLTCSITGSCGKPISMLLHLRKMERCFITCNRNKVTGVRQRSVLSPFLFTLYLVDLSKVPSSFGGYCIVLYADDVLLLPPSVSLLEKFLHVCERELGS